ncbi:DUF2336 domain-containing protein [Asticcacaulis sp. AND118]|uniref:DUF2336 domain-containing protein n=1 Tax=Asticcacaulis sp. AND118 TaxID=2840468 RepID=UPI001CFFFEFE|nr:DUF2336 domain-containing protein [Asticcacaulis sp. AND118]UDF04478.1 DUF2336 domain-containing protein [Asticcacaulis sp. AND118]
MTDRATAEVSARSGAPDVLDDASRLSPVTLSPITQVRTLLHLMQLNAVAQRQAGGDVSEPPSPLNERLAELIRGLPSDAAQPILDELARADWAEPGLIAALCRLPLPASAALLHSPALRDADLLTLIGVDEDKARLIAARPHLSPELIDALLNTAAATVAIAVLNNRHLRLSETQFETLADRARADIALRAVLTRHPQLTRDAASQLLDVVGPHLRETLLARFDGLYARQFRAPQPADGAQTLHRLQQGDFRAFRQGLSRLTGLPLPVVDTALHQDSAVPLVLLLTAAGIDRATFPNILAQVQTLNSGHPRINARHLAFVRGLFDLDASEARQRLMAIYSR